MKENVRMFIIGVLVGAIITTGAFLIYTAISNKNQTPGFNMPSMPNGEMGEPPERPNGEQPPERSNENNSQNNESNSY